MWGAGEIGVIGKKKAFSYIFGLTLRFLVVFIFCVGKMLP